MDSRIIGIIIGGILAIVVFLVGMSYASIENTQIGLDYSGFSKTISTEPFQGGTYLLGLGHSFIKFPKTTQPCKLSKEADADRGPVESRTSDGLEVVLDVSFQYSLISTKLYDLYMAYKENYKDVIVAAALDVINDMATSNTAYGFFVDRGTISTNMEAALREALNECCYVTVNSFQLADVDLPDEFEHSISESEVKNQDIKKAEAEYSQRKIELETMVKKAEANKEVLKNKALGDAASLKTKINAEVGGFELNEKALIDGYTNIKASSQQTANDFLAFLRAKLIDEYKGKSITVGLGPIKHKKPSKPTEPVEPVEPAEPVEPVEPAKPVKPVEPVEPAKPAEPVEPAKPAEPVEPATPVTRQAGDNYEL